MTGKEKCHFSGQTVHLRGGYAAVEKGAFCLVDNLVDYLSAFREEIVKTETGIKRQKNSIKIPNGQNSAGRRGRCFASVDPVNQITICYAQYVLLSPGGALRAWLFYTVRADLLGEKVHIPNVELNYGPSITY